jgi:hypothetical protein
MPCPRQLIEDPTVATERANVMREASWIQPIEVHGRTMLANDCLSPLHSAHHVVVYRRNLAESALGQEWLTPGISTRWAPLASASEEATRAC